MKKKTQKSKQSELKPWSGRFREKTHRLAERYNASIGFDRRLLAYDVLGSIAHAKVLGKARIITARERDRIIRGLRAVEKEIASGL
jgi:argininosuccinate lyase